MFRLDKWPDYPDQEARDRRARMLRDARKSARSTRRMLSWTDAPILLALALVTVLALACERAAELSDLAVRGIYLAAVNVGRIFGDIRAAVTSVAQEGAADAR